MTDITEETLTLWLIRIMYATRKNKRYGRDSIEFESQWVPELRRMARAMSERWFRVERNYAFLTSIPKWREIFATEFQGRMADHLLCDSLSPYIEQELHPRTFNNRKVMGSQAAINQVIEDICEVSQDYRQPCRVMKWDLKGFFPNANLDIMEGYFQQIIDQYSDSIIRDYDCEDMPDFLKWLAMVIIHCCPAKHCELRTPWRLWDEHIAPEKSLFNKPDGIGAPIGRMTSQTGMGLYLNDEIRWLNDDCGIRTTLFMDDGVMVVPESQHWYALSLLPQLRERLKAKGVRMNDRKFYDQPYEHGLEFLGTHVRPWALHLNNSTYGRGIDRIREYNAISNEDKPFHLDRFISTVNSYTGMLKNRTDFRRCLQLRDTIADAWWQWLDWDYRRLCVVSKPEHGFRQRLNRKYHLKLETV